MGNHASTAISRRLGQVRDDRQAVLDLGDGVDRGGLHGALGDHVGQVGPHGLAHVAELGDRVCHRRDHVEQAQRGLTQGHRVGLHLLADHGCCRALKLATKSSLSMHTKVVLARGHVDGVVGAMTDTEPR